MDIFEEYMFKAKKTSKDYLASVGIVIAAAAVSCLLFMLPVIIAEKTGMVFSMSIPFLLTAVAFYGAFIFIQRQNTELEYTLVNSEMDVDKIMGRKTRKRIIEVDFKAAEIVAAVGDDAHSAEYARDGFKVYDASGNYSDNLYFADFSANGEKTRLIFRPTEGLLSNIKKFNPGKIFIKE